ncbi:phosphate ABC transporter substrate-binding protein [Mucilaginibacter sp. 14171R-50]|uniref:PstS family phosphate ABC transporter substrate-binding protein n=1 Tax=Mucilaginibacter sp. 14171R-50 TaxID=2703789 RepID=UPI00138BA57B|nr:substrate-binding domain-containing protein [Mucilaginibacter sp. 14171R-50]QHS55088.1 phosphate ABC transporter substrate-binding protein [Mucilaginibacter sp. 14171R-50]
MKFSFRALLSGVAFLIVLQACKQNAGKKTELDGFMSGTAVFGADESFSPIIDEELYIFKAAFPDANPVLQYKAEADVVNDLMNDKYRVAILPRTLDTTELGILKRRSLTADTIRFAIDAIALIVNQASNDTLISVNEIKSMLNGRSKTDKNIVFDNPNSSLVRYLKTLSGNNGLKQKNIYALSSSKEVIKYVSTHPNSIGITGFSWLNDPDKDYADAVDKVKIVGVRNEDSKTAPNQYFKPSQETLVQHTYPLSRALYIIDCTGRKGLGAGFASFLASERGQRIILKSGLLPDSIPPREINIIH